MLFTFTRSTRCFTTISNQVDKQKEYHGTTELKLGGCPWWADGNDAVEARYFISSLIGSLKVSISTTAYEQLFPLVVFFHLPYKEWSVMRDWLTWYLQWGTCKERSVGF
jgi:hypothetical protein